MNPVELYQKLLKDNNLKVTLTDRKVSNVDDGSTIIGAQSLVIEWLVQPNGVETGNVVTDEVKEEHVKTN